MSRKPILYYAEVKKNVSALEVDRINGIHFCKELPTFELNPVLAPEDIFRPAEGGASHCFKDLKTFW